eukprot:879148-Amphidinium_carterae.1
MLTARITWSPLSGSTPSKRRLKKLLEHNAEALVTCHHFVTNYLDTRLVCMNCGNHGYASFKTHWLREYCPSSHHMKQEECGSEICALKSVLSLACRVTAAVAAVFRKKKLKGVIPESGIRT